MKKTRNFILNTLALGYIFTAGYYGLDMFIMYLNPLHLIMVLGSALAMVLVLAGITTLIKK